MAKVMEMIRSTLIPISRAASVSKETARIALPTFVWLTTYVRMNINAREMIRITICWLLTTIPQKL